MIPELAGASCHAGASCRNPEPRSHRRRSSPRGPQSQSHLLQRLPLHLCEKLLVVNKIPKRHGGTLTYSLPTPDLNPEPPKQNESLTAPISLEHQERRCSVTPSSVRSPTASKPCNYTNTTFRAPWCRIVCIIWHRSDNPPCLCSSPSRTPSPRGRAPWSGSLRRPRRRWWLPRALPSPSQQGAPHVDRGRGGGVSWLCARRPTPVDTARSLPDGCLHTIHSSKA